MTALETILEKKIVAIIRGSRAEDVQGIIAALLEGGVGVLEVTLNTSDALTLIRSAADKFGSKALIGAGTVLDADSALNAMNAGAKFIVSPSFDPETIHVTKEHHAVSIPGAFTATEILAAHRNGADIVKVFPASVGPGYIKDIRGPFSNIRLMPTGGVNLENIADFKKAGAVAYGIGSALVDSSKPVTGEYLKRLTENARKFVDAVK